MKTPAPQVGEWFQDLQTSEMFEVVALDANEQTIEVQYLDGELSEYDPDSWQEMTLQPAEAPEDWRTPFELADEDGQDPDQPYHPEDWDGPLNHIEPESSWTQEDF